MAADIHREQRIAKNTLMLYVRMLFLMLVGFYTSRVVLNALGESDFGIYGVVGGVVAMFTIISGSLSAAITRFITFEMGKSEEGRLPAVFSSAVTIQVILALIVVVIAEPAGIWFIENHLNIPADRIPAAHWVFQFSLLTFVINIISIPYNASIVAHEKMSAFSVIGIMEGIAKLGVAFLILRSPIDSLIYYAALMCVVAVGVRMAYTAYCRRHFEECRFRFIWDRKLLMQMFSFAGWNFIGVASGALRDHGGNILINIFSGPAANAARTVSIQLGGAVQSFVTNFMTAVNPQITKSYAAGDHEYMFSLVRRSSRLSFCLLYLLALPVIFNAEYLLGIWLKEVPAHAPLFVQLFLIFALSESLSNPLITAMLATGDIRNYQIVVGGIQLLNIPISYVCLKMGAAPESTVVVSIVLSQICLFARLVMLGRATGFPVGTFLRNVWLNVIFRTVCCSIWVPFVIEFFKPDGFAGFCLSAVFTVLAVSAVIYFISMDYTERLYIKELLKRKIASDDKNN